MAHDLSTLAASPIEITYNGSEYRLAPLNVRAWGDLEQWLRSKVIKFTSDGCTHLLPAERLEIMREAMRQAAAISLAQSSTYSSHLVMEKRRALVQAIKEREPIEAIEALIDDYATSINNALQADSPEAKAIRSLLSSPDGMLQILMLSLRKNHSGITPAFVENMADTLGQLKMQEVIDTIMKISQPDLGAGNPPQSPQSSVSTP